MKKKIRKIKEECFSKKQRKSSTSKKKNIPKQYLKSKVCENCLKSRKNEILVFCEVCDDSYHRDCLRKGKNFLNKDEFDIQILCSWCKKKAIDLGLLTSSTSKRKQTSLSEYFNVQTQKKQIKNCNKCREKILQKVPDSCIRCKENYHSKCFSEKKSSILCSSCEKFVKKDVAMKSTKIENYFKQKFKGSNSLSNKKTNEMPEIERKGNKKTKKMNIPNFKVFFGNNLTTENRKKQITSLLFALKAKNIEFDDDLHYTSEEAKNSNRACNEPGLAQISGANKEAYLRFKELSRKGIYPPIEVVQDKIQGFIVKALEDIPSSVIICEYVGEVDFTRNRLYDSGDSIMDLLTTGRSATSLVIVPDKFGNLARFLSGVNNFDGSKERKQNVFPLKLGEKYSIWN